MSVHKMTPLIHAPHLWGCGKNVRRMSPLERRGRQRFDRGLGDFRDAEDVPAVNFSHQAQAFVLFAKPDQATHLPLVHFSVLSVSI